MQPQVFSRNINETFRQLQFAFELHLFCTFGLQNLFCTITRLQELCLKIAPTSTFWRCLKIVFCFENNSVLLIKNIKNIDL